jgi:hypothetical protein
MYPGHPAEKGLPDSAPVLAPKRDLVVLQKAGLHEHRSSRPQLSSAMRPSTLRRDDLGRVHQASRDSAGSGRKMSRELAYGNLQICDKT